MRRPGGRPPGHVRIATLDPFNRQRSWLGLAAMGLLLITAVMVLMVHVLVLRQSADPGWLREAAAALLFGGRPGPLDFALSAAALFVAFYVTVGLHEAIHGAFFWLFTRRRPVFGVDHLAAFSAAHPDAHLTRNQYLAAALAPLVVMTAGGLSLLLVAPPWTAGLIGFVLVANAAGAPSDLRVAAFLLLQPREALVHDGDAIDVYAPAPPPRQPAPEALAPPAPLRSASASSHARAPAPGDDTTLSVARANAAVVLVAVGAALALVAPFVAAWGQAELWRGVGAAYRLPVLLPATLAAIVVHEGLHGLGYRLGGAPPSALHFGVNWKVLSPFAGCRHPLRASAYRFAIVLPALVLGGVPWVAGMAVGSGWMVAWGYLMVVMAAGDLAALWAMRRVPGRARVLDHPSRVGCRVVEPAAEPLAAD